MGEVIVEKECVKSYFVCATVVQSHKHLLIVYLFLLFSPLSFMIFYGNSYLKQLERPIENPLTCHGSPNMSLSPCFSPKYIPVFNQDLTVCCYKMFKQTKDKIEFVAPE